MLEHDSRQNDSRDKEQELTELLFEYRFLRELIQHNDSTALQILGGTVLSITTITGFALVIGRSYTITGLLLIAGAFIAYTASSQAVDRAASTFRTAAYLSLYVERKLKHIKWETMLMYYRRYLSIQAAPSPRPAEAFVVYQLRLYSFVMLVWYCAGCAYMLYGLNCDSIGLALEPLLSQTHQYISYYLPAMTTKLDGYQLLDYEVGSFVIRNIAFLIIFLIGGGMFAYRIFAVHVIYRREVKSYSKTLIRRWGSVEDFAMTRSEANKDLLDDLLR